MKLAFNLKLLFLCLCFWFVGYDTNVGLIINEQFSFLSVGDAVANFIKMSHYVYTASQSELGPDRMEAFYQRLILSNYSWIIFALFHIVAVLSLWSTLWFRVKTLSSIVDIYVTAQGTQGNLWWEWWFNSQFIAEFHKINGQIWKVSLVFLCFIQQLWGTWWHLVEGWGTARRPSSSVMGP